MSSPPWERITDDGFRNWLLSVPLSGEEYNAASVVDRAKLRTEYENSKQNSMLLEQYRPALDFAQQQLEAKTEHKAMSVASYDFARVLLSGRGINVEVDIPNNEKGSTPDPSPYNWTVETTDEETYKKGEHQGTRGARDWFQQNFVGENGEF